MVFTAVQKGYQCPDLEDCTQCPYRKTKCIVFSEAGKKRYKELVKKAKQNQKWVQGDLFDE